MFRFNSIQFLPVFFTGLVAVNAQADGLPVSGSLAGGESVVYEITNLNYIELDEQSGYLTMQAFDSTDFSSETALCNDEEIPIHDCVLPEFALEGTTIYVRVTNQRDDEEASYALSGQIVPIFEGSLRKDESSSHSIGEGQSRIWLASDEEIKNVIVESTSGDADLAVYGSLVVPNDYIVVDEKTLRCDSEEYSEDSVFDECPTIGWVEVYGYTDATFTITGSSNQPLRPPPPPTLP
ncbi:MAG: hypothetical protein KAG66_19735 [Methylococcales bacterium]|nr:hypothetical protein [Methylococcales bacterium]